MTAALLKFPAHEPAPTVRPRAPRSLKPLPHATLEFAERMIAAAHTHQPPYRKLTRAEAYRITVRMVQLTANRLYRMDNADLLSLAAYLAPTTKEAR